MLNELFRTYKKIIILVLIMGCAIVFWFFGCHRDKEADSDIVKWEQFGYEEGGYGYKFETNDLKGNVIFGIKGFTVKDKKIPVTVEISSRKDFSGIVKITVPGSNSGGIAYQSAIHCEKGESNTMTLTIPQLGNASYFLFELLDQYGNSLLSRIEVPAYSQWIDADSEADDQICVGILSDQYESLSYMDEMILDMDQEKVKIRTVPLDADTFPVNQETMDVLTALIIDDYSLSNLSKKQENVLLNWVKDGGDLILATGQNGEKVLSPLENELKVTPGDVETERLTFDQYSDFSGQLNLSLNALTFEQEAAWKMVNWSEPASFYEKNYGNGYIQILRFSFTDESILQWNRLESMTKSLMKQLLGNVVEDNLVAENGLWNMEMALNDFNRSQTPNTFYYSVFFIIYICALAVVAYFMLRRIKKREYIWIVVPCLSLVFTVLILIRSKGGSAQTQGSMSAIRVMDDTSDKNDVYFLYQNTEGESLNLNLLASIDQVVPMDFDYMQDITDSTQVKTIQEEYTVSNTTEGYQIDFSEATPGTMRMLEMTENKSMNYGEKTRVFSASLVGDHTAFSGDITNESSQNFDKLIVIRANQYWCTGNMKAGETITVPKDEVRCWSQDDSADFMMQDGDSVVTEDIENYLIYRYMENNSDLSDTIVIGITLDDDFQLLKDRVSLDNQVSVYANHCEINRPEKAEAHVNININDLSDGLSYSDFQTKFADNDRLEAKYQFNSRKIVWAMARARDGYEGKIYAYNYNTAKEDEILSEEDDVMTCEELEPYLSEMNDMKLIYEKSSDTMEDNLPVISIWLKKISQNAE